MLLIAAPILWILAVCLALGARVGGYRRAGGLALLALLVFPLLYLGWCTLRPDLLISPIDRVFMTEFASGTDAQPRSLVPAIFHKGMTPAQVDQILQQDGFAPNTQAPDDVWYGKNGPSFLRCSSTFRVEAKFDASGLVDALGYKVDICV